MVAGEVGGAPAVDGVANILGRWYHHCEYDEEEDGVTVVESIDEVVVIADVDLGDLGNGAD